MHPYIAVKETRHLPFPSFVSRTRAIFSTTQSTSAPTTGSFVSETSRQMAHPLTFSKPYRAMTGGGGNLSARICWYTTRPSTNHPSSLFHAKLPNPPSVVGRRAEPSYRLLCHLLVAPERISKSEFSLPGEDHWLTYG